MTKIKEIIAQIEAFAPRVYQESYDNSGLLVGDANWDCVSIVLSLDCIESVVDEAIEKKANLIICHHPILFRPISSLTGKTYVERTVIKAIQNNIAIYAAHTNIDNVRKGVNAKFAERLQLKNCQILSPKTDTLRHLITFVPKEDKEKVQFALFEAGAGEIGNYSNCSFSTEGLGTFLGNEFSNPNKGKALQTHTENEIRIEVLVPIDKCKAVVDALHTTHPYEEVAYFLQEIDNENQEVGSGMIGELDNEVSETDFIRFVSKAMKATVIRHTELHQKPIKKVAVCGGAGSFLLSKAKAAGADAFVSADFSYHQFFDAENDILILDIGHFESEQYTIELFHEIIVEKFPNFAVHFSEVNTNPIKYFYSGNENDNNSR